MRKGRRDHETELWLFVKGWQSMMFKLGYKPTHCRGFWCCCFFKSFTSTNSEFGRFGIWVLAFSANSCSFFYFILFFFLRRSFSHMVSLPCWYLFLIRLHVFQYNTFSNRKKEKRTRKREGSSKTIVKGAGDSSRLFHM